MLKKLLILSVALTSFSLRSQGPTWADDVACIVYTHCTSCHNPKGAAPFSLLDYNTASLYAASIRHEVEDNHMPPWPVDNSFRKMAHDRSLTEGEKITILQWIDRGTPQGNMGQAPPVPVYNNIEEIPNPDVRLQIPTYTVPSITEDLYRCFVLPTGLSVQKFITGIEIIPGNKSVVHHAQVFYDTTGITTAMDAADPAPGYTSAGGVGTNDAVLLGTWVPGSSAIFVPKGMGKRLPASARIIVQIHYPHYASGATDSTRIHLLFTNDVVRNIYDAPVLNHFTSMTDGPLFIPKNTVKTFHQEFIVPLQGTLLSIGPHGHLICRSMKAYGVTLAGDTIPLVHIPKWDFHWQGSYDFPKPIRIPFGTKLYGEATYDNTIENPDNPNSPPKDVSVGEATTDEMMLFYFSYLPYVAGDEHIVIDSFDHKPNYKNCLTPFSSVTPVSHVPFRIFPNPASAYLRVEKEQASDFSLFVYNQLGDLVFSGDNTETVDISGFSNGIYYLRFMQDDKSFSRIFVKE